ncbi:MAG: energy transducer TonB [Bacteroidota bacterium]|jgi:protein TonB
MKHIIFAIALLAFLTVPAQSQEVAKVNASDYAEEVDTPPEIVGGMKSLYKEIEYPEAAKEAGIQGMVILRVLIGESGSIDDVAVEKSDSDLLSDSAMKAVREIRFKPGLIGGKAVKTKVMIPVKYKLA